MFLPHFTLRPGTEHPFLCPFSLKGEKKAGIKLGRPTVDDEKLKDAFALYESKRYSVKEITDKLKIS